MAMQIGTLIIGVERTGPQGPPGEDGGAGAVTSVFSRTGAVVATSGDYTSTLVTRSAAGGIAATTVEGALIELAEDIAAVEGGGGGVTDHGALTGLGDDDHTQYLLAAGTRELTGNLSVSSGITIDGRDLSADGTKLDGIEALADVTDAANVAAAGAVMTSRTISTTAPVTGGGDLSANRTIAIDAASGAAAGSMSAAHYTKLEGIEAGANLGAPKVTVATNGTNGTTLADSDDGKVVRVTWAGPFTVTVPSGLTAGTTVEYVQEHASGQITVTGSGVTLRHPATYDPATAEQWSSLVVTILDTDEALVRGDLAEA
jgi:hypothetical protein